jgi:Zn-dependent protease with chaperone function
MVGFYGLALVVVGFLVFMVYAQVRTGRIDFRLLIFSALGTVIILASIIPRRDRFRPPGPRLDADRYPELHKEIKGIAGAVGQEMPAEIYLLHDLNAWVMQRGGRLGFGGERVMGIGLPLLEVLNVRELRAVLAHEFGHFHGGDTSLGPVIYRTRTAIARTVAGLKRHGSVLQLPFVWYGKMYLRITHAVSRSQEYAADRLAAGVAGVRALRSGLRAIHRYAFPYALFWEKEFVPVVAAGYHAPLREGFRRFIGRPEVEAASGRALEAEMEEGRSNPYDTHPVIRERLAALDDLPPDEATGEARPAAELLGEADSLEWELLNTIFVKEKVAGLKPISWEEVGDRIYLEGWTSLLKSHGAALEGITPADLADLARDPSALAARLQESVRQPLGEEEVRGMLIATVGAALALALSGRGWRLNSRPGLGFRMVRGEKSISTFSVLPEIAAGKLSPEKWVESARDAGIEDVDLGRPPATPD